MHIAFFTVRMKKGFGVDLVVDRWARSLAGIGNRVSVFCFDYEPGFYDGAGYDIVPLHLSRDRMNRLLPSLEQDTAKTLARLGSDLGESGRIDLALPASFPFYGAGRILRCPAVHLHFGNPPTAGLGILTRVNRAYLDASDMHHVRRADGIIAISRFLRDSLPKSLREKAEIVYPGGDHLVDLPVEERNKVRDRLGVGESETMLLSVSRLDFRDHPYKGVLELANLAARLRAHCLAVRLALAGVGSDESVRVLEGLGAKCVVASGSGELASLYRAADVFVSLSRWEGFGLPVVEAAFFGLPTVALNITAHRETAVSCPAENIPGAEKWITRLTTDGSERTTYGASARALAAGFSWRNSGARFISALTKLGFQIADSEVE